MKKNKNHGGQMSSTFFISIGKRALKRRQVDGRDYQANIDYPNGKGKRLWFLKMGILTKRGKH